VHTFRGEAFRRAGRKKKGKKELFTRKHIRKKPNKNGSVSSKAQGNKENRGRSLRGKGVTGLNRGGREKLIGINERREGGANL